MASAFREPLGEYLRQYRLSLQCIFCILLLVLPVTDSLLCYQCASGDKEGGDCKNDYNGLVKSAYKDINQTEPAPYTGRYTKDCSTSSVNNTLKYCVLEVFKSAGVGKSYIRDCSDGETFSYTGNIKDMEKLKNPQANNETTCTYRLISNMHVCITLCTTDFCNGPIVTANDTNCTDNATCSANRLMWTMAGPFGTTIFNPFLVHPLIPVTLIYVFVAFMLS